MCRFAVLGYNRVTSGNQNRASRSTSIPQACVRATSGNGPKTGCDHSARSPASAPPRPRSRPPGGRWAPAPHREAGRGVAPPPVRRRDARPRGAGAGADGSPDAPVDDRAGWPPWGGRGASGLASDLVVQRLGWRISSRGREAAGATKAPQPASIAVKRARAERADPREVMPPMSQCAGLVG